MTLAEFIEIYIKEHDLSARQFASNCGLSHGIVNKIRSKDPNHEPTVETIYKISAYTGVSMISLIKIAFPEYISNDELSGEAEIIARGFEKASPQAKEIIRSLVAKAS